MAKPSDNDRLLDREEVSCSTAISPRDAIRLQRWLLGHEGLGVTELRIFDPWPQVAYADSPDAVVDLCREMEGRTSGIYTGVQPRPVYVFDRAPNRWVRARGGLRGNCARDHDIEYITGVFFDVDAVSSQRRDGHPASPRELEQTLRATKQLIRQDGLGLESVICCSGNGHYVLLPIVPISIDGDQIARQFDSFCRQLAKSVSGPFPDVRIDPVYNLSRVMRVMGTWNGKGEPGPDRPHRRAHFVTEPMPVRSVSLHHMILNTEVEDRTEVEQHLPTGLKCDLATVEGCEFIQYCRRQARAVSEPQWFALITNLARLQGGVPLIHQISALDSARYDRAKTQRVIDRVFSEGYRPAGCRMIVGPAMDRPGRGVFRCSRIGKCPVRAPMYLATSHTIYTR